MQWPANTRHPGRLGVDVLRLTAEPRKMTLLASESELGSRDRETSFTCWPGPRSSITHSAWAQPSLDVSRMSTLTLKHQVTDQARRIDGHPASLFPDPSGPGPGPRW